MEYCIESIDDNGKIENIEFADPVIGIVSTNSTSTNPKGKVEEVSCSTAGIIFVAANPER